MSYARQDAVWGMALPPTDKLVLLALAFRENATTGATFPSTEQLAADTGYDVRTVQRSLRRLEAGGHVLTVRSQGRSSNRYRVTATPAQSPSTPAERRGSTPAERPPNREISNREGTSSPVRCRKCGDRGPREGLGDHEQRCTGTFHLMPVPDDPMKAAYGE